MAALTFVRAHSTTADEASEKIRRLLDKFASDYPRLKIKTRWSGNRSGTCSGRAFKGTFSVDETNVRIDVKLGFLARPFSDRIQPGMERRLLEAFPTK